MPFIRSLVSEHSVRRFRLVAVILLLGEIMPIYFRCTEKKLVYIIITVLSSYQPSSYFKCIKLNIYSFYDI